MLFLNVWRYLNLTKTRKKEGALMIFGKRRVRGRRIKQKFFATLTLLAILFPIAAPIYSTFADDESDVKSGYTEYAGDSKNTTDVIGKLSNEDSFGREDSFRYLFSRIINPGYINDVSSYVEGAMPEDTDTSIIKNGFTCDSSEPMNLISANCDIPNFSAQLGQNLMRVFVPNGIAGGDRKSAKAILGWGVPDGIPTGQVPADEASRTNKYTGLEVFGYSLGYTDYSGEWDDIVPSTKARLLSNFGLMDEINLTGASIWEGTKAGLGSLVEGLSWDPTTWLGNVTSSFEKGSSRGLLVIIDTSDANIVATRAWVRSGNSVGGSFYNVKVLTDKEVMEAATALVATYFTKQMEEEINGDPELKEVLDLQSAPVFTFDPNKETEASKKARAEAEDKNRAIDQENEAIDQENEKINKENEALDGDKKKQTKAKKEHVKVPDKVIVPEEEQFADFKKDDPKVKQGEGKGITCSDEKSYDGYKACWATKWEDLKKKSFDGKGEIIKKIQKNVVTNLIQKLPHSDPSKAISHYVCADSNGNAKLKADGSYEYVYTDFNRDGKEQVNPACSPIRPTIKGGYFGSGDQQVSNLTDTRHISKVDGGSLFSFIPIIGNFSSAIQGFNSFITKLIAQFLNEMLNLSFSPLMEKLGISTIVKSSIASFRQTIFYPLITLVIMIASLMMIIDVLRTRNATKFFSSLGALLLTFFIGAIILNSPDKVINVVDTAPAKVEQFMLGLLLNNESNDGLCTTVADTSSYGVRSAQCNIWRSLVYQPWAFGQWGVSDNKLNAANTKPPTGETFTNTNENLVGNASVNLGGGTVLNNWALYQLKLTTSGTLTATDPTHPVGKTDNNLYRIVDAQAGPNDGAGRETRYYKAWTGSNNSRFMISQLALILAIFMVIVVGSLLIIKIEVTFIFSIMLIGLPFIFLFGLTPKGRGKLLSYLGMLISLLLKRFITTFMISLLLLLVNVVVPENANSYTIVFLASMLVLGFFKMYKEEIFNLFKMNPSSVLGGGEGLLSGDSKQMKEIIKNNIPLAVRNKLSLGQGRIKGQVSGAIGGVLGGATAGLQLKHRDDNGNLIKKSPTRLLADLRDGVKFGIKEGSTRGGQRDYNRNLNKMLRSNMDGFTVANQAKEQVQNAGSQRIKNGVDVSSKALFDDVNKKRNYQDAENENRIISDKDQRILRKQADEVEKFHKYHDELTEEERKNIVSNIDNKLTKVADRFDKQNEKESKRLRKKDRKPLISNKTKVSTSIDEIKRNAPGAVKKYNDENYEKDKNDDK